MSEVRAVDWTGTEISLTRPAKRIVCLTAAGLDSLLELDMEPVGYLSKGVADRPEFYGDRAKQFVPVGSWIAPNLSAIRRLQPDLVIGWTFPHRFYRRWLGNSVPLYLMGGTGYEAALNRLRDIAQLTDRVSQAEAAITRFDQRLEGFHAAIPTEAHKTILFMGGSTLNRLSRKFIIETSVGTMGSVMQQFTHFPWIEPAGDRREPGLMNVSLQQILQVDPDVIFVQTYSPAKVPLSQQLCRNRLWQRLKAVQNEAVYEIDQLWHFGNGTRMLGLTLDKLMPIIYPELIKSD